MGVLDNKGVKKIVDWFKGNLTNLEQHLNQLNYKIENKTQGWIENSVSSYGDRFVSLNPNSIIDVGYYLPTGGIIYFNEMPLPEKREEYKIIGNGYILNGIAFPSVFEMGWPNNEKPVFEDNKEYEIYIAGGRVVSVTDITQPMEEIKYIIDNSQECYFAFYISRSFLYYKVNDGDWIIVGREGFSGYTGENLKLNPGHNTVEFKYNDLTGLTEFYIRNYDKLKLDCSKMKSSSFHEMTQDLIIDEIIYPQSTMNSIQDPIYDFVYNGEIFEFYFLKHNKLDNPNFKCTINGTIPFTDSNIYVDSSGRMFRDTNLTNRQVNAIIRNMIYYHSGNKYEFAGNDFAFKHKYYTIGTYYNPVNCYHLNEYPIAICAKVSEKAPVINGNFSKEAVLYFDNQPINIIEHNIPFEDKILFIQDCDWENSVFDIKSGHIDIYTYDNYAPPQHVIDNAVGCSFHTAPYISNIPFQYIPYNDSDIKNYDENGNVID